MSATENKNSSLDLKLLSRAIYQFNIARTHSKSYPEGHPQITSSAESVTELFDELLRHREELTVGVVRDHILVDQTSLEENNPVFKALANSLFEQGVAALSFRKNIPLEEILFFNKIINQDQDYLQSQGGIEKVVQNADLSHLSVKGFDYSALHVTEEDAISKDRGKGWSVKIWKEFVRGLVGNELNSEGMTRNYLEEMDISPAELAEILNKIADGGDGDSEKVSGTSEKNYAETVSNYLRELDKENLEKGYRGVLLERIGDLIKGLGPDLQNQFLNISITSVEEGNQSAGELLKNFPDESLFKIIDDVNEGDKRISSVLMGLLQGLSDGESSGPKTVGEASEEQQELEEKMRVLFQEEDLDIFVPEAYQHALGQVNTVQKMESPENTNLEDLKKTLEPDWIERNTSAIILELLRLGIPENDSHQEALKSNLSDAVSYLTDIGDFRSIDTLYTDLLQVVDGLEGETAILGKEMQEIFREPVFLEEVLNGLAIWGTEKYDEIKFLLRSLGSCSIDLLINRLGEEDNISRRKYYISRLIELRKEAFEEIFSHLNDERWYLVRNLILILRSSNDPLVLPPIKKLLNHEHPKVHQEVLRALFQFKDREADKYILQWLESDERDQRMIAIPVADSSHSTEVVELLFRLLTSLRIDLEEKRAVLTSLGKMNNPHSVSLLKALLKTVNPLLRLSNRKLKLDILACLSMHSEPSVGSILEEYVGSGSSEYVELLRRYRQREGEKK